MPEPPKRRDGAGGEPARAARTSEPGLPRRGSPGRWCRVSLRRGAGGSPLWRRPARRAGVQGFILAERWAGWGCAWPPPPPTCPPWSPVSRSEWQEQPALSLGDWK